MAVIAHIGNIPVEEWLPFVVPVVALYLYGRRKDRHRRNEVERLPEAGELLERARSGGCSTAGQRAATRLSQPGFSRCFTRPVRMG